MVMANGVLCYIKDLNVLREVVSESMRILKKDGVFSATMLQDNEVGTLGWHYGSIQATISQKLFWEALEDELGYRIISVDYMGMWSGFEPHTFPTKGSTGQGSRYAIQLRKMANAPSGVKPVDLAAAIKVSTPTAHRELYPWIILASVLALLSAFAAL